MHTEIYTTTILVATFLTAASFALALPFENDGKNPEGLVTWKAVVANHQEGDAGWSADLVERMRSEGVEEVRLRPSSPTWSCCQHAVSFLD